MPRAPLVLCASALLLMTLPACGSLSEHDRYAIEPYYDNVYPTAPHYGDPFVGGGGPRRR